MTPVAFAPTVPPPEEVMEQPQAGLSEVMTGRDQLTADDYILPYIDDSDTEQDEP